MMHKLLVAIEGRVVVPRGGGYSDILDICKLDWPMFGCSYF